MYADKDEVTKFFGKEHAVLVANHGCEVDWLMGWTIGERVGILGNARSYIKRILQYAPVLGWSWKFQEFVMLDRNWEQDKKNIGPQLRILASYPDPIWLTLFAEGTRFTEEKYLASVKVAKEKGLQPLLHHLLPRTRGFVASVPHLKGKVAAIYDVVVAVDKNSQHEPSVFSMLKGREVKTVLLFRRIPLEQVPDDEKEAGAWLHKLFQEKDKVLDNYVKYGEFIPAKDKNREEYASYKNFTTFEIPRRPYTLLNSCFWLAAVLIPLVYYLCQIVMSGDVGRISVVAGLIGAAHFGFSKLIGLAKVSTGSKYGSVELDGQSGLNKHKTR
ncbi:1-acyl-sn-glycerol-3-phosphate acyltransferase gamma isoform X2 [Folsomia candida]|nr:1-acyl-sn-glycerol-3-phosphate acyltransferase gamma isoform X2 [Folsomia candida]